MSKPFARIVQDPSQMCCPVLSDKFASELRGYASRFKALADETRLEILALLAAAEGDALCACHIEERFDLSQPTISHHLKVLREAGLVVSERRGSWVYYALERRALRFLKEFRGIFRD